MIRAVLLDLDDTLYDEADYVRSGFRVVAREMAGRCGKSEQDIYQHLLNELALHGRGRVFDATLAAFDMSATPALVAQLLEVYRSHRPAIRLFPEVDSVLNTLRQTYRLAIVTDGLAMMQRHKVEALGLDSMVDAVIYCWEHDAPKPQATGFQYALDVLGVSAAEAVVVGDRPEHDLAAAAALACPAIRLRRGRYAAQDSTPYDAVHEITALDTLPDLIASLIR